MILNINVQILLYLIYNFKYNNMKEKLINLGNGALDFLKRNAHSALLVFAGTQLCSANMLKFALIICLWAFVDLWRNK